MEHVAVAGEVDARLRADLPGDRTNAVAEGALGSHGVDGKYGQADLGGSVWEWNLDWNATDVASCDDCAYLKTSSSYPIIRSGSFGYATPTVLSSARGGAVATARYYDNGFRCARSP